VGPVFLSKGGGSIEFLFRENSRTELGNSHGYVKPDGPGNEILRYSYAKQEINLLAFTFFDHKTFAHFREKSLCEVGRGCAVGNVVNIGARHDDATVRRCLYSTARTI